MSSSSTPCPVYTLIVSELLPFFGSLITGPILIALFHIHKEFRVQWELLPISVRLMSSTSTLTCVHINWEYNENFCLFLVTLFSCLCPCSMYTLIESMMGTFAYSWSCFLRTLYYILIESMMRTLPAFDHALLLLWLVYMFYLKVLFCPGQPSWCPESLQSLW